MEQHVFIARQPILNRAQHVLGYELLFRPSDQASGSGTSSEQASARVLTDAVMSFGLETLTLGRLAFINVTRGLLLGRLAGLEEILPPDKVVLELLEDIEADDEVVGACRMLRQAGYALALDDFVLNERNAGLVPLASYVKIDQPHTGDPGLQERLAALCHGARPLLLAEKVETVEQFDAAAAVGFDCFQGFFFGRPATQCASTLPVRHVGYLRLLRALQDPDLDVTKLERIMEHDPSLCYRLLRTVNSAGFRQASTVTSIRQAVILMGVSTVRQWASLWLLAGLGDAAHPELMTLSIVRARCCELLAAEPRQTIGDEGFLLGMCSLLDAILRQPMPQLVAQLPLSLPMQAALLGDDTPGRRLLDCVIAHERGDWSESARSAARAGLAPQAVAAAHREALRWSAEFALSA